MELKPESELVVLYGAAGSGGDEPQAYVAKAKLFLDKGRVDVAEHLYRRALAIDPHFFWANMGLARVCILSERFDDAAKAFHDALDDAGNPSQSTYARTGLATALAGVGKLAQAEELFEQVIAESPDYVYAYTGLALLYETFPLPPWEKIVALCETALALAPTEALWVAPKLENAKARVAQLALLGEGEGGENDLDVAQQRQGQDAGQLLILFRRKKFATILESCLRDQPLPYVLLLRQLFERVDALSAEGFVSLPAFFLFAADFLAGEPGQEAGVQQNVDLSLANRFYELSLEGKTSGLPEAHLGLLKLFLRTRSFDRAEAAVIRAIKESGDNPAIVAVAAQVMQAMERPAIARLLSGRALELAPVAAVALPAVATAGPLDALDKTSRGWLNLEVIHDTANNAKAGKLNSVEEWLASVSVLDVKDKRALPVDPAEIEKMIAWLGEFFSLLGDHAPTLLFDIDHYRQRSGVWFKDIDEALLHYFEKGWKARLNTHAAFDAGYLRRQLQQHKVDSSSEPPLLLFLRHEHALGLSPNELFDPATYTKGLPEVPQRPWFHYLEGGWQQNPNASPFFDMERFRSRVRRTPKDALLPPLMFYFTRAPDLDINRLFHAGFYERRYRDSVKDKAPLAHYLSEGVYLGYQPNPFFVSQGKTAQERLDYLKIHSAV